MNGSWIALSYTRILGCGTDDDDEEGDGDGALDGRQGMEKYAIGDRDRIWEHRSITMDKRRMRQTATGHDKRLYVDS